MIIFLREMVRNRKSFIIWTLSLILLNVLMMTMYPTMAEQSKSISDLIKTYPKGIVAAFGMDKLSFSNILSFFGIYSYLYLTLFGSIYAMLLGAGILSKEESDKTVEFLLAKPVKRNTVVTGKLACALFYILLLNVLFAVTSFFLFEAYKRENYDIKTFLLLSFAPALILWTYTVVGMLISVFVVKAKSVFPVTIGVVLGTYFLGIASAVTKDLAGLKYLSPFKYADAADIIQNGRIDGKYLLIFSAVIVISITLTYVFYNRKNITA